MSDRLSLGTVPRKVPRRDLPRRGLAATAALALLLAACSPGSDEGGDGPDGARSTDGSAVAPPVDPDALVATISEPQEGAVVLDGDGDPAALAAAAGAHFFTQAPVVVLTSADEQLRAASAAVALGVPV
ncbi:MAG TPA: hypothetical protein VLO09_06860, partial [Ornithinimicrobium sp.]|nr:hypothetical protein [Ornithinimicrobium sp.]